jgi:hypothetical protein
LESVEFDKRTSLGVAESFPAIVHSGKLMAESVAKDLCARISSELVSVVPQINDYICPVCFTIAYWPVRLACKHIFCIRCVVKMQRRKKRFCPLCRAEVLMSADASTFVPVPAVVALSGGIPLDLTRLQETSMKNLQNSSEDTFSKKRGRSKEPTNSKEASNSGAQHIRKLVAA